MGNQDSMMAAKRKFCQVAKSNIPGEQNSFLGLCKTENLFVFCGSKAMIANVDNFMAGVS